MPETMSPREKMARIVSGAEVRVEYDSVGRQYAFVRDAVGTADAILATLASSGDHAELARLAEAATQGPWVTRTLENFGWNIVHYRGGDKFDIERVSKSCDEANAEFIAAANPATVLALIAENAALRGQYELDGFTLQASVDRATEAERKLAEAVGLLREWRASCSALQCTECQRKTDAFLSSKEAERG